MGRHANHRGKGARVKLSQALKPSVENFGFATFLSLSATSVWGGIFPFLPDSAQTSVSTILFYALQLAAFSLTFLFFVLLSYRRPDTAGRIRVLLGAVPLSMSGAMLIAAMYLEAASMQLIVASALLYGFGSACFMTGWQRVFAAKEAGGIPLIAGTAYSAVLYFLICLIPVAITAYLIPFVMVPLATLCLWIAAQGIHFDQAMFEDHPYEHPAIYRNAVTESLGAALSIGALGFCAGAVRFIFITHQSLSSVVNVASMAMLLVAVVVYLAVGQMRTIRFDVMNFYHIIFPVVAIGLLLMPFMGEEALVVGAAISYGCFSLATVVMMIHCRQISRDGGINPVFIYALFGMVVYAVQTAGYFAGFASGLGLFPEIDQLPFIASVSLFVLLIAALVAGQSRPLRSTRLEFLALSNKDLHAQNLSNEVTDSDVIDAAESTASLESSAQAAPADVLDVRAQQCRALAERFGLSSRETEVVELLSHGRTGPAIAEELFISENTVRTHIKRIYAKVGVSKKQALLAELEKVQLP